MTSLAWNCGPNASGYGGTRTYHRITCAIEDAGFEIRDCLTWLYAKGFPKSANVSKLLDRAAGAERPVIGTQVLTGNAAVSLKDKGGTYGVQVGVVPPKTVNLTGPATDLAKEWDGYGTALKPAWEPIILARKPLDGTIVQNVTRWGCGALNIDGTRVKGLKRTPGYVTAEKSVFEPTSFGMRGHTEGMRGHTEVDINEGRWPANLILDEEAGSILDRTVGQSKSTKFRENVADGAVLPFSKRTAGGYSDSGGPSRFFFSSKVSTKEREAGCALLPMKSAGDMTDREEDTAGLESPRAGAGRTGGARNHHPTLKPISLTEYIARLIMPPCQDSMLLVPFSGAGSEVIGALKAGWSIVVGIEREEEYVAISRARISHHVPESIEEK